jgi:hypothetical protein
MNTLFSRWEKSLLRMYNKAKGQMNAPQSIIDEPQGQLVCRCGIDCEKHGNILSKVETQVGEILTLVSYDEWSQKRLSVD